jgi:hypothetical protein
MTRPRERLNSHDLIIQIVGVEAGARPEIKVIRHRHRPTTPLPLSHREVLLERGHARDRRLVVTCVGADLVCAAVGGESAERLCAGARVVGPVVLDDIVFGLGGVDPAVDREVGAAICGV